MRRPGPIRLMHPTPDRVAARRRGKPEGRPRAERVGPCDFRPRRFGECTAGSGSPPGGNAGVDSPRVADRSPCFPTPRPVPRRQTPHPAISHRACQALLLAPRNIADQDRPHSTRWPVCLGTVGLNRPCAPPSPDKNRAGLPAPAAPRAPPSAPAREVSSCTAGA